MLFIRGLFAFSRSETNSAATLRNNSVKENKDDGCSTLAKELVASETDAVALSVQGSHPAYLVSSGKTREGDALQAKSFDARRMKHMTLLVVCSENGSVTLSTIEVTLSCFSKKIYSNYNPNK